MAALRGDISFRYLKQFFLVLLFVILICLFLLTFIFKLTSVEQIVVCTRSLHYHNNLCAYGELTIYNMYSL